MTVSMEEPGVAMYAGATDEQKDHVCVAVRFRPLRWEIPGRREG